MKENKNKKSVELGKNELGEISGGSSKLEVIKNINNIPQEWKNIRLYYGVPNRPSSWEKTAPEDMPLNPFQPQVTPTTEEDINKLNPLPDTEQNPNK